MLVSHAEAGTHLRGRAGQVQVWQRHSVLHFPEAEDEE